MSDEDITGLLAVVADCGTSTCRAGMSGDEAPKIAFPTVVGRSADGAECVVGAEALARGGELGLRQAYAQKVEKAFEQDAFDAFMADEPYLGLAPPEIVERARLKAKRHKKALRRSQLGLMVHKKKRRGRREAFAHVPGKR